MQPRALLYQHVLTVSANMLLISPLEWAAMSNSRDYNLGSVGTYTNGSAANQMGLAQHRYHQQKSVGEGYVRRAKTRLSTDHWIRIALSIVVGASTGYLMIQVFVLPFYWPVGVATLLAIIFYQLLLGPLRVVVRTFRWILLACAITFAVYAALRFLEALRTASK